MTIDADTFRRVLASWTSGVTIVTSAHGEQVQGMTVSSFSSVSLEPPLVLVCGDESSNTSALIDAGRCFTVNVLAEEQEPLSRLFSDKAREEKRFEELSYVMGATGCPRIEGAISFLDCRLVQSVEAGDHRIHVGEVVAADVYAGRPLVYLRGDYRRVL